MSLLLTASWVCPIHQPPLRNAGVTIEHGRITRCAELRELAQCEHFDHSVHFPDAAILPGLINAHTHLELSCYRGQIAAQPLWTWFEQLVRLRRQPGAVQREHDAIRQAVGESVAAGVTCVGDISRTGASAAILKQLPIRKVCFAELLSIAAQPPRTVDELRAALDEVSCDALLTAGVSVHAPYTVHPRDVQSTFELSRDRQVPWCMHWLETQEERAWLSGASHALPEFFTRLHDACGLSLSTRRVQDYLAEVLATAPPGLLAHGNYTAPQEFHFLAERGHAIAYCPRTHRYFGHPQYLLRELLDAGVRVALATDSLASNPDLSVLEEARFVYRQQPDLASPIEFFRMMTLDAAAALGQAQSIGSLTPGKWADLAVFDCPASEPDPLRHILASAHGPRATYLAGERVYQRDHA